MLPLLHLLIFMLCVVMLHAFGNFSIHNHCMNNVIFFCTVQCNVEALEFPKAGESQYFHSEKYRSWQDIDS